MKRRKIKKVRTTICIDEDIFIESGDYIYNLSAFVQECMRREIQKQKEKKNKELLRISANKQSYKNDYIREIEEERAKRDEFIEINGVLKKSSDLTEDDIIWMLETI